MKTLLILTLLFCVHSQALTLDQALDSAFKENEVVGQQREILNQAREHVKQATGGLLPNISASATYFSQPAVDNPALKTTFPKSATTTQLTLTQPLFRGLREFAARRLTQNLYAAQEQDEARALQDLYINVVASYLQVLALEQDIKNLSAQAELYANRVKELRGRVRSGESSSTEALTAQSTQAALEAEIQLVTSHLTAARENFRFVTGLAPEALTDPDLLGGSKTKGLQKIDAYLANLEQRADVRAADERLKASEEGVSIARGAHWPYADLVGNYYFDRPKAVPEELNWDVQIRLVFPLFEGGTTQSKVREANSKKMQSEFDLRIAKRSAEKEIRTLYQNILTRIDQVKALEKAVELSEKNYQVLQRESRRGLARNIDLQLALAEFRNAKRTLDQAHFSAQLDLVNLQAASSTLKLPR